MTVKISVSLPDADVAFLDAQGENRSATVHKAVQLLRRSQVTADQYAAAFEESAAEQAQWDATTADGLSA